MRLQSILIGLFVALVTTAGVFWFLDAYEYKEVDEYTGFQGEARENPLFAARLFLKRMGIPSERHTSPQTLPDADTVLVIDTDRYTLSRQKSEALLAWVANGGHLITRTRYFTNDSEAEDAEETNDHDPLQLALGITRGEHIIPEDDDLPLDAELSNMNSSLHVDPEFFYALQTTTKQAYPQKYNDTDWLLEIEYGDGLITWAANLDFIENSALDDHDHAEFFWYMLHGLHDKPQAVWLIHSDDMPALSTLLWEHAWALVLTLAVFIPLTILALSPRFGPLIPKPAPERRRILEHIHASGLFMWQRHRKHADTQYAGFAARVTQLLPSTRKQHDNSNPDA
ncbi:DUF4350 domain-containing protein [Thiothrix subterranea]|uniref:DUF4350 domain-containing protein n=1 Tax=Thiothrix subterranea TaxID=2735563 RepID=A0AA51MKH3_9GAMM|nr:DUF4350 domain-containing protein [Thiothrix subterranea]MDQ5767740.1 DUF4350 domain-containing protein [Thiothrix subterranea]WML85545.1 DUF4350 domain-containing protein [Thiothrix subterranea]